MSEALRLAELIERDYHDETLAPRRAAAELRRLHAELERKSDAIQRLWKERDELRALNAELVEALRRVLEVWQDDPAYGHGAADKAWELLVKIEANNGS